MIITFKMADTPEAFTTLATEYERKYGWVPGGKERYAFEAWLDEAILTKAREVCNRVPDTKPINAMGYGIDINIRATVGNHQANPRFDWGLDGIHVSASLTYDRLYDTEAVWDESKLWIWEGPISRGMDEPYIYNGRKC